MATGMARRLAAAGIAMLAAAPTLAQTSADTEVKSRLPMTALAARPPVQFQPGQKLAPVARTTIFVRDIDASLKLYRDILGLQPMFDNYWKGKGINDIMGTQGKELRAVVLMAGDSAVGNIGLYQLYNEKGPPPPAPARNSDTRIGDVAVVLPTNDIWGLTKRIQAAGYVMISPPVALIQRPNMKQQPLEMMFRDADGVLVNLVQAGVPAD